MNLYLLILKVLKYYLSIVRPYFLRVEHNAAITSTVFAYNDNYLYISDSSNKITKLNVDTRKQESTWTNKKAAINVLAITHNDKYLVGAIKSRIKIWNTKTGVILLYYI